RCLRVDVVKDEPRDDRGLADTSRSDDMHRRPVDKTVFKIRDPALESIPGRVGRQHADIVLQLLPLLLAIDKARARNLAHRSEVSLSLDAHLQIPLIWQPL